jgi:hexosaminidase
VFAFLEDVLAEVMDLFPSRWIHVGGDECPKVRWKSCPKCQERIRREGLRDEHELQKYLINRMETYLVKHGRVLIGWDEILESGAAGVGHAVHVSFSEGEARTALSRSATVQSWRGTEGGIAAARSGHDVIMSPNTHCYLDYDVRHVSTRTMYAYEPVPQGLTPEQAGHVLGLEGAVWTEGIAERDRWDHQAFPRLCALAEAAWTDPALRRWDDFRARAAAHAGLFQSLGVRYWHDPEVWAMPEGGDA